MGDSVNSHNDYNTSPERRPTLLIVQDGAIPQELRDRAQWVLWLYEWKDDRWTKVPYQARAVGKVRASVSEPKTWTSFGAALSIYQICEYDGIGFVLTQGDPIIGVDLDKCIGDDGLIAGWAQEIVVALPTYWEVSPSGKGLRGILKGALPPGRRRAGAIEIYDSARFLTITGKWLPGASTTIAELPADIEALHTRIFAKTTPDKESAIHQTALSDDEVIRLASLAKNADRFRLLWDGDISGYASASEADAALCAMLAFYTQDAAQLERLMSQSGLNRDKWGERADYRRRTIDLVLGGLSERYTPLMRSSSVRWRSASNTGNDHSQHSAEPGKRAESAKSAKTNEAAPDPPGSAVYAGLAGDFVWLADQYTEADPVAVLAHFLAAFGCAVGREPHFMVGATRHEARLFPLIVGKSSKARKGDSFMPVRTIFELADPEFLQYRVQSGLASGEGLINAVRDSVSQTDGGVSDKRLFVIEPEFARLLAVMTRQGNTLSAIIRDAWDRGNLQNMTRNAPLRATGAHLSIVGHITTDELRRELTDTDAANGFANRFIVFWVKRSKSLPEPGIFEGRQVEAIAALLADRIAAARNVGRMVRDEQARALWLAEYDDLSAERDGLVGSILARGEAQVVRLAMIYALLDGSDVVRLPHLQSALELWRYSERCGDFIFGDATGDRIADEILRSLKQRGAMSRTEIYNLFARHIASARIGLALDLLSSKGLAVAKMEKTDGRPVEVWSTL